MKSTVTGHPSIIGRKPFNRTQISQRFRRLSIQPLAEDLDPDLQKPYLHHPEECNCFRCDQYDEHVHVKGLDFLQQAIRSAIFGNGVQTLADFFPNELQENWKAEVEQSANPIKAKDKHQLSYSVFEFKKLIDGLKANSVEMSTATKDVLAVAQNKLILRRLLQKSPDLQPQVIQLLLLAEFWVRPLANWTVEAGKTELRSLIDHLLVIYPAPKWMYEEWSQQNPSPTSANTILFITMVQGGSLELTAKLMGWQVSRTYSYFLMKAPSHLSFQLAATHAELARLGCKWVTAAFLHQFGLDQLNPFLQDFKCDVNGFLSDFVIWLDKWWDTFEEIQRLELTIYCSNLIEKGETSFRWIGRSPRRVLEESRDYHLTFAPQMTWQWKPLGWDWHYVDEGGDEWRVVELTRGLELLMEGRAMRHCILTYASYCNQGINQVFSLTKNGSRTLTIQIRNKSVGQVRGRFNRFPNDTEKVILNKWWFTVKAGLETPASSE